MAPRHVLLVPLPIYGHIHPLLQLAVQLAKLGTQVTFVSSSTTRGKTLSTLDSILSFTSLPQEELLVAACKLNIHFVWLSVDKDWESKLLESNGTEGVWNAIFYMASRAQEVQQLVRASEHGMPVLAILDMLVPGLHDELGSIPTLAFWTASASFILLNIHLKTLVEGRYVPLRTADGSPNKERLGVGTVVLPGTPELSIEEDIPYNFQDEDPRDPGFERLLMFKSKVLGRRILVNTFQKLEKDALEALREEGVQVVSVGPLLPPNTMYSLETAVQDGIWSWLSSHAQSSVVYVSLGTLACMAAKQIHQLALGLEDAAFPFLWILRKDHWSLLPEGFMVGFLERTKHRGLVVDWSSQSQVLRHPAVGVFLTHGGWNSLLESMTSGIPLLCWPFMVDQNLNSKYVADVWKTGKKLGGRDSDLSGSYIAASIKALMEDHETRKNARLWMEASQAAVTESCQNLKNISQATPSNKV